MVKTAYCHPETAIATTRAKVVKSATAPAQPVAAALMPRHPRMRPMSRGSLRGPLKARINFTKGVTSLYAYRFDQHKELREAV